VKQRPRVNGPSGWSEDAFGPATDERRESRPPGFSTRLPWADEPEPEPVAARASERTEPSGQNELEVPGICAAPGSAELPGLYQVVPRPTGPSPADRERAAFEPVSPVPDEPESPGAESIASRRGHTRPSTSHSIARWSTPPRPAETWQADSGSDGFGQAGSGPVTFGRPGTSQAEPVQAAEPAEAADTARGPFEPKLSRPKAPRPRLFENGSERDVREQPLPEPGRLDLARWGEGVRAGARAYTEGAPDSDMYSGHEAADVTSAGSATYEAPVERYEALVEQYEAPAERYEAPDPPSESSWLDTVHWESESDADDDPSLPPHSDRRHGPFRRRKGDAA
jgi:hypothetical protein